MQKQDLYYLDTVNWGNVHMLFNTLYCLSWYPTNLRGVRKRFSVRRATICGPEDLIAHDQKQKQETLSCVIHPSLIKEKWGFTEIKRCLKTFKHSQMEWVWRDYAMSNLIDRLAFFLKALSILDWGSPERQPGLRSFNPSPRCLCLHPVHD